MPQGYFGQFMYPWRKPAAEEAASATAPRELAAQPLRSDAP
jgi:hypothetical protein